MVNNIEQVWADIFSNPLFNTAVVILVAAILYAVIHKVLNLSEKSKRVENMSRRGKNYVKLINSFIRTVFLILTLLIILQVNGVNITSILAGVGIVGVVMGLAIQDTFKDIVRGLTIIIDNYFSVGDVIKLEDGTEAKVTSVGIRTTKLKSITDGTQISLSNRNIDKARILPSATAITLPLPYDLSLKKADEIMNEIGEMVVDGEQITEYTYRGVRELGDSHVGYLISVKCQADKRGSAKRALNRAALTVLEKHKVAVPYKQIDIHNK